jgi:chromosome partitioning protein
VLAIANHKGGVGKTTTTLALGAALAARGRRTLLVDLDPQAGLTAAAGIQPDPAAGDLAAALLARDPSRVPRYHVRAALDLIPACPELASAEPRLQQLSGGERTLARTLEPLRADYRVVLLDCPPALSALTFNALVAADEVLVPVAPEYLAARALPTLIDSVDRVRSVGLNPRLRLVGVVLTLVGRTAHARRVEASLRGFLGTRTPVLGSIPRSTRAAEAAAAGVPLREYAAGSPVVAGYERVVDALVWLWSQPAVAIPAAASR